MKFIHHTEKLLGTQFEFSILISHEELLQECLSELQRIEQKYSRFIENNTLSEINSKLNMWQGIDDETFYLVSEAKKYEKETGTFTLSTKEVLEKLGYDQSYSLEKKGEGQIGEFILKQSNSLKITKPIEIGGLGKGYAIDQLRKILESCPSYYINAGGDVFAKGKSPEGGPWSIILEHPSDSTKAIGVIELDNKTLAVSSASRRSWGNGLHHLINPKTRSPAQEILCVYVVSEKSIDADAYATALFVMSFKDAIEKSKELPVEVILVSRKGNMYQSKGFDCELFT